MNTQHIDTFQTIFDKDPNDNSNYVSMASYATAVAEAYRQYNDTLQTIISRMDALLQELQYRY